MKKIKTFLSHKIFSRTFSAKSEQSGQQPPENGTKSDYFEKDFALARPQKILEWKSLSEFSKYEYAVVGLKKNHADETSKFTNSLDSYGEYIFK